ncbi:MAG: T9SS type A sorting domain-containing protein [Bacteroidota bacterium]
MKKIAYTFLLAIICNTTYSQVYPFIENFNSMTPFTNPSGWTCTVPGFQVYPTHGNGSQGLTKNMSPLGASADSVISPIIGPITISSVLSFDFRVMEASLYPCCSYSFQDGDAIDFYAMSGPLSFPLFSIDSTNYIPDTAFQHISSNIGALAGNTGSLMIKVRRGSGDFFVDFDNFSVTNASSVASVDVKESTPVVYPNPASDGIQLQLKNVPADDYTVKLLSSSGDVLDVEKKQFKEGNIPVLNTRQLNRGLYFLQLNGVHNNFLLRFVVKN